VLGLPAEGPAAYHGACWKVLVAMAAGVCGRGVEGLPYKSAARGPLAARRPTWSSRRRALVAGADGQTRHQCLADNALYEAEVAAQTGQYRGGEDGSCCVAAMWARSGHKKVRTDRSPVRANPLPHLD
jgi:hypothetical protein